MLCISLGSVTQMSAQHAVYTGSNQILVDNNCQAVIDWNNNDFQFSSSYLNRSLVAIQDNNSVTYTRGMNVPLGTVLTVIYSVSSLDSSGQPQTTLETFTLRVSDVIAPTLVGVPADAFYNTLYQVTAAPVVSTMDNCNASPVLFTENSEIASDKGLITRDWSTRDDDGNVTLETQKITVTFPEFNISGFINRNLPNGGFYTSYDQLPLLQASDILDLADGVNDNIYVPLNDRSGTIISDVNILNRLIDVDINDVFNTNTCPLVITRQYTLSSGLTASNEVFSIQYTVDDTVLPGVTGNLNDAVIDNSCFNETLEQQFVNWSSAILENANEFYFTDAGDDDLRIEIWFNGAEVTNNRKTVNEVTNDLALFFRNEAFDCNGRNMNFEFRYQDYCQALSGNYLTENRNFNYSPTIPTISNAQNRNVTDCDNYSNSLYEWLREEAFSTNEMYCASELDRNIYTVIDVNQNGSYEPNVDRVNVGGILENVLDTNQIVDYYTSLIDNHNISVGCSTYPSLSVLFIIENENCPNDRNTAILGTSSTLTAATFRLVDNTNPIWSSVSQDTLVNVQCATDLNSLLRNWTARNGGNSATDNCSGVDYTFSATRGANVSTSLLSLSNVIPNNLSTRDTVNVLFTATDKNCNSRSTSANFIFYNDNDLTFVPVLPVANQSVVCTGIENDGFSNKVDINRWIAEWDDPNLVASCNNITVTNNFRLNDFNGDLCGRTYTVTFTYTDQSSNSIDTTVNFVISDTESPFFTNPISNSNRTVSANQTEAQIELQYQNWLSSFTNGTFNDYDDRCDRSMVDVSTREIEGDVELCGGEGLSFERAIEVRLIDNCNNSAVDTAYFTVIDNIAPVIDASRLVQNFVVECNGDNQSDIQRWLDFNTNHEFVTDNGSFEVNYTALPITGGGLTDRVLSYTFQATDACGNLSNIVGPYSITITDTQRPQLLAPSLDLDEITTISCTDPIPDTAYVYAEDQCDGRIDIDSTNINQFRVINNPLAGGCVNDRELIYQWSVSDSRGLTDMIRKVYHVKDQTAPIFNIDSESIDCRLVTQNDLDAWMTLSTGATGGITQDIEDNCAAANQIIIDSAFYRSSIDTTWVRYYNNNARVGVLPTIPANVTADFSYEINVFARDICGNKTEGIFEFFIIDNTAPTVIRGFDDQIQEVFYPQLSNVVDLSANTLGRLTAADVIDNCSGNNFVFTFEDEIDEDAYCGEGYALNRIWTVTDLAGNSAQDTQYIAVRDIYPPTFTTPADITVRCEDGIDTSITGLPTLITDNVDTDLAAPTFSDDRVGLTANTCTYIIHRTWTLRDACDNVNSMVQIIKLVDDVAPIILTTPQNYEVSCRQLASPENLFNEWVESLAMDENGVSLTAMDACDVSLSNIIGAFDHSTGRIGASNWYAFNSNTSVPATYTDNGCETNVVPVDFIAIDSCGNERMVTLSFSIVDEFEPELEKCADNKTVNQGDLPNCEASVTYTPDELPLFVDACHNAIVRRSIPASFVNLSPAIPGQLIGNQSISFLVDNEDVALADATFKYSVSNFDGESEFEYFLIKDETGRIIGRTPNSDVEGGTIFGELNFTNASINDANEDGIVTFIFEALSVDDSNQGVESGIIVQTAGLLEYDAQPIDAISYSYTFNGITQAYNPLNNLTINGLSLGTQEITFTAEDCSGNESTCSSEITVIDNIAPIVDFFEINDTMTGVDCSGATVEIPQPHFIEDCNPVVLLRESPNQMVTFSENANIDGFVMDQMVFEFDVPVNDTIPYDHATLEIFGIGDFDNATLSEQVEIVLEDETIVQGIKGTSSCNGMNKILTIQIDSADVMDFASGDGKLKFIVQNISFNNSSDGNFQNDDRGVNPCDYTNFTSNTGENIADGVSQLSARFSFPVAAMTYEVIGATHIAVQDYPTDGSIPTVDLNEGENIIKYTFIDEAGNESNYIDEVEVTGDANNLNNSFVTRTSPTLRPVRSVCEGESVTYNVTGVDFTRLNTPTYVWYHDVDGNAAFSVSDSVIGTTNTPEFTFDAPFGARNFKVYVQIQDNKCVSRYSNVPVLNINSFASLDLRIIPSTVCEGEDVVISLANGIDFQNIETYEWSGPEGFSLNGTLEFEEPVTLSNLNENQSGWYSLTLNAINGCTTTDSIFVEVVSAPVQPTVASSTIFICEKEEITLEVTSEGDKFVWVPQGGSLTESLSRLKYFSSSKTLTIQSSDADFGLGTWTVYSVNENNCMSLEGTTITIEQTPGTVVASDVTACEGSSAVFSANITQSDAEFTWTGPNNFFEQGREVIIEETSLGLTGTYELTVDFGDGCVLSDVFELKVNANQTVDLTISASPSVNTICPDGSQDVILSPATVDNSLSYVWTTPAGTTSNTAVLTLSNVTSADVGTYELLVTTQTGCEIIETYNLSFDNGLANVAISGDEAVCLGTDFILESVNPDAQTIYTWTLPNGNTSDGATLQVLNAELSDAGTYTLNASKNGCVPTAATIEITVSEMLAVSPIQNISVCQGEEITAATPSVIGYTYEWRKVGTTNTIVSNTNTLSIPVASSSDAGTYELFVSGSDCIVNELSRFEITVNERLGEPQIASNSPVCGLGNLELIIGDPSPNTNTRYSWFLADGTFLVETSADVYQVSSNDVWATIGTHQVYAIASLNGCVSDRSAAITVQINEGSDVVANAGADTSICVGQTIGLSGNSDGPILGEWSQVSGPNVPIVQGAMNLILTNLGEGVYVFRYTLTNSCGQESTDDVEVNVTSVAGVANAGGTYSLCGGTNTNLNAILQPGFTGMWTSSSAGIMIAEPTNPQTAVSGLSVGQSYELTWAIINACGEVAGSESTTLTVSNPNESASISGETVFEVCGNGTLTLKADPTTGSGMWTIDNPNVSIANSTSNEATASGLSDGIHTFTWTVDNGSCGTSSVSLVAEYDLNPTVVADEATVSLGKTVTIDVLNNDANTTYNFTQEVETSTAFSNISRTSTGAFFYESNGQVFTTDNFKYEICSELCPADPCTEATVTVTLDIETDCNVPTIFTPNGDGINDQFIIPCVLAYPSTNSLKIFNEWGDEVFTAQPYDNSWEGTFNGNNLPVGTYFYIFDAGIGTGALTGFIRIER